MRTFTCLSIYALVFRVLNTIKRLVDKHPSFESHVPSLYTMKLVVNGVLPCWGTDFYDYRVQS